MPDRQLLSLLRQTCEADVMRSLDGLGQSADQKSLIELIESSLEILLEQRNVAINGLLVVLRMLDCRLNPKLDLAAVSNVEIVLAENNVKAFPHAMTCCNVTKCYSRRLIPIY